MKRVFIAITIMILCFCMGIFAHAEATFTVDTVNCSIDEQISVSINFSENTSIAGGVFEITYNSEVVEVVSANVVQIPFVSSVINATYAVNKLKLAFASSVA